MMKSYKKMADEVLDAVKAKNAKKINRKIKLRIAVPSACCLAAVLALTVWQSGALNKNGLSSEPEITPAISEDTTEQTQEEQTEPPKTGVSEETAEKTAQYAEETSAEPEKTEAVSAAEESETAAESEDTSGEIPAASTADEPVSQTENSLTEETQAAYTVPIEGSANQYMRFVDNVHAPLDDYEFTLPLTPKDTDIILALLNAYGYNDPDDAVPLTQYALDVGIYLETGSSFVRTHIQAAKGDEVYALEDGKVIKAGYDKGLGNAVYVENSRGTYIVYFHLDGIAVSVGDAVSKDQVMGYAGTTGIATSSSAAYIRRDDVNAGDNFNWHLDDNKISIDKFGSEEPPKENILPVEPPMTPKRQSGNQSLNELSIDLEKNFTYGEKNYAHYCYANKSLMGPKLEEKADYVQYALIEVDGFNICKENTAAYSVIGYDPKYFICLESDSGIEILINADMESDRGSELFEDMLGLSRYERVCFFNADERGEAYSYSNKELSKPRAVYPKSDTDAIEKTDRFLNALADSKLMAFEDMLKAEITKKGTDPKPIRYAVFSAENDLRFVLELYEGGYVRFSAAPLIAAKVDGDAFGEFCEFLNGV